MVGREEGAGPPVIVRKTELEETRDSSLEASCVGSLPTLTAGLPNATSAFISFSSESVCIVNVISDTRACID
jgi:hypothetical protein